MTTADHAELPRSRERLAVLALAFGAFVITVNVNLAGALMPFLREDPLYAQMAADVQARTLGRLISVASATGAVGALLLGPWIDRVGRRGPMALGGVVLAAGLLLHLWVGGGEPALWAGRALSGFGGGLVFTSASAAVADLVPYHRRGAAMGLFSVGLFLATPVGLPLGVEISKSGPEAWRWAFGALVVPALLAVGGFWLLLPKSLGQSDERVSQWQVLRAPSVVPALLSVGLYTGAFMTTVQFAADWLHRDGLLPRERQWMVLVFLGFSTAGGSLLLARLADRFGKRAMVMLTTAGVAVCLLLLGRAESVTMLILVGLPMTLLGAARTPALQALMSEIVDARMRGTLMGLRAAALQFGAFVCTRLGSDLYAEQGFEALATAGALLMVLAYFAVRFGVRTA